MDGSIELSARERKTLLHAYRCGEDVRVVRRAHIVLLLAEGLSYREVRKVTFASYQLIRECCRRFRQAGLEALSAPGAGATRPQPTWWSRVITWLTKRTPQDFGYFRSRWSCAILAEVLAWETGLRRSAETIRRVLRRLEWVWRRPRPVVGLTDVDYQAKLRKIRHLLSALPDDETAVYQDEVDVHLNPRSVPADDRGAQAEFCTPGSNDKRHHSSLHCAPVRCW
jgi:transposase